MIRRKRRFMRFHPFDGIFRIIDALGFAIHWKIPPMKRIVVVLGGLYVLLLL
jgi:hypothetical protein